MESKPEQESEIYACYSLEEIGLLEFTGAIKRFYGVYKEENSVLIFLPTNKEDNRIVALVPPIDSNESLFFYFDSNSQAREKFNNFLSGFLNQVQFENLEDLFDNDYELLIRIFFTEISLKPENKNLDFQGKVEEVKKKLISFGKTDVVTELLGRLRENNSKKGVILFPINIESFWVCAEVVLEIDNLIKENNENFNSYNYNIKFHFPTDEPDCYEEKKNKICEKLKKILESKNMLLYNKKIKTVLLNSEYDKVRLKGDYSNFELMALEDLLQRLNGKDLTIRSEAIIRMKHQFVASKNVLLKDFSNNQSKILNVLSNINKNFYLNEPHISLLYKIIVEIYNLLEDENIQTEQSKDLEARTLQANFCLNKIAKLLKLMEFHDLSKIISIVAWGMDYIQFFKKEENSIFELLMIIFNDIKEMIINKNAEEEILKKEITSAFLDLYNNYDNYFIFRINSPFHMFFNLLNKERKAEYNIEELMQLPYIKTSVPKNKNKKKKKIGKNKEKENLKSEILIKNEEIDIQTNLNFGKIFNTEEQSNSPVLKDENNNKNIIADNNNNNQNLSGMESLMKKLNNMESNFNAEIQSLKINNNNMESNLKAEIQTLKKCIETQKEKIKKNKLEYIKEVYILKQKLIQTEKSEAILENQVNTLQSYYNRLVIREEIKIFKNIIRKQVLKLAKSNNIEFVDQCGTNKKALSFEKTYELSRGSLKSFFEALITYETQCHSHIHTPSFNLKDAESFTNFLKIFNTEFRNNKIFYGQFKNDNITILNEVIKLYKNTQF